MGEQAASNLRKLFGKWFSTLDTDNEYKAFQLAIWEIVKDSGTTSSPGTLDLDSGGFTSNSSLKGDAEAYLNDLGNVEAQNLVVLTRDGKQDQIAIVAPAPPALVLSLAGLIPLAGYGWYRRRARGRTQASGSE
jgi:hypothetical protein